MSGIIIKIIKWIVALAGLAVLLAGAYLFSLRFHDGPVEFFPWFTISIGGPFRSGEPAPSPTSWDFIRERQEIEFQSLEPPVSRTVWLAVHDGRLFILSGYMNTRLGRLWKQWPRHIEADSRIILRIDGRLYPQRMQRITEGPEIVPVMTEISRKYGGGGPGSAAAVNGGFVWMFEVVPR